MLLCVTLDPDPTHLLQTAARKTNPTQALQAIATLRQATDSLEHQAIEAALAAGHSWQDIADALGVTRQAVHRKYRHRINPALAPRRGGRRT